MRGGSDMHCKFPDEPEVRRGEGVARSSGRKAQFADRLPLVGEWEEEDVGLLLGLGGRTEDLAAAQGNHGVRQAERRGASCT
jgi:hypothetical protein